MITTYHMMPVQQLIECAAGTDEASDELVSALAEALEDFCVELKQANALVERLEQNLDEAMVRLRDERAEVASLEEQVEFLTEELEAYMRDHSEREQKDLAQ
jgi:predicted trehalose synthase